MMTLAQVLEYFERGYAVYGGSYYGESLMDTVDDIIEDWDEVEDDEWLYIESVEVDEEAHEVHYFIGNDE